MASALSTATTKEEIRDKILRCAKSWIPIMRLSIPGLREEEHQLVEVERERRAKEQEQRAKEQEQRAKEQEKREMEIRVINLVGDYEIRRFGVSRKIFDGWATDGKQLIDDDRNYVVKYEEIKEDATYFFEVVKNFDAVHGYIAREANIQTRDCVKSIPSGIVGLEDFAGEDVTAILEYNIDPPKDIAEKGLGFRFPLRPDAVLISADKTKWLVHSRVET